MAKHNQLVRTPESLAEEEMNKKLCLEIMGFKHEYQVSRHVFMRQIRILHETMNDLVLELYGANPQHILFRGCGKKVKAAMAQELSKRENGNNYGFGKLPRNELSF